MHFVRLGKTTSLNLASVASISWERKGSALVAIVKYLIPLTKAEGGQSSLASERFTGEAAQVLYDYMASQTSDPHVDDNLTGSPADSRRNRINTGPKPASLNGLLSGFGTQKKGWYYVKDTDGRSYFLAMVNMKGSCSMRTFDPKTGKFLGKRYQSGNFQDGFAAYLKDARELVINKQPNLERDCREKLPSEILCELKNQTPE
jgi:hypothetical protein